MRRGWDWALCGLWLATWLPTVSHGASPYRVGDVATPDECEYLILAADDFADACDDLLAHRAKQGMSVGVAALSDALAQAPAAEDVTDRIAGYLALASENWGTQFVLIVGDGVGEAGRVVPTRVERSSYFSSRFLSSPTVSGDFHYAALGGEEPVLHVGRFPADHAGELAAMIGNVIRYETATVAGPWQRRVAFVAGVPGFDAVVDAIIEAQFTQIVGREIPAAYEVRVAHSRPASPYCPYPPGFADATLEMLNAGSLFFVYAGHGLRTECDDIRWRGERYPILSTELLDRVRIPVGAPMMVMVACHTAVVDSEDGSGLGAQMMGLAEGPVAYFGATRVCQPYGNALLGREMVMAGLGEAQTAGEMMTQAFRALLAHPDTPQHRQFDALAAMVQGADALAKIRRDTVRHYILLGDPALKLRKPSEGVVLTVERGDGVVVVRGETALDEGTALVSLEVQRYQFARELPAVPGEEEEGYAEAMTRRFASANDKAVARAEVAIEGGRFEVRLGLGESVETGGYLVKAICWDGDTAQIGAFGLAAE